MSPKYAGDDTDKVRIDARAGVAEYLIVKPYGDDLERRFSLIGNRFAKGVYRPWIADADGCFHSQTVGVCCRVLADCSDIEVVDRASGNPLMIMAETELQRRRKAARADAEAARARKAESQAERLRVRLRKIGIDPDSFPSG